MRLGVSWWTRIGPVFGTKTLTEACDTRIGIIRGGGMRAEKKACMHSLAPREALQHSL